jgi:hypothetical protein
VKGTIFVTGAQRSGTTLLERLFGAQPDVSMLSQPFPLLLIDIKREFLAARGVSEERYPLGHLFLETRVRPGEFDTWLREWRPDRDRIGAIFDLMTSYSGQYTRFAAADVESATSKVDGADFPRTYATLVRELARNRGASWCGSKETTCEEFVRPLLAGGVRCAMIVRDPRDVVTSLNFGRGPDFAGEVKPTLFNVRSWRKSVATILELDGTPGFAWCRYEDLVSVPVPTMQRMMTELGIDVAAASSPELRDPDGNTWSGNSSHSDHRGVAVDSVGAHRRHLPPGTARFIEAVSLPELHALGYESSVSRTEARDVIETYREPTPARRFDAADLSTDESAVVEIERLQRLHAEWSDEQESWFLNKRAHARLRSGFRDED